MKRKGFTLPELLAVIVILAVIALIAIPMIINVIEKSRRQSAIESVNGLLDAGEKYQLSHMLEEEYATTIDLTSDTLKHKGAKPESGTLVIGTKGRMSITAKYNNYCIVKTFDEKTPHIVDRTPCIIEDSQLVDVPNYKEPLLNGADPVLESKTLRVSDTIGEGLIPVIIESNGTVKKANLKKEWYKYEEKRWANAVILKDESITYKEEEIIPEENIESYFVWIPKYKYQLWDLGNYNGVTSVDNTKVHTIPIIFGIENTEDKENECKTPMNAEGTQGLAGESGNCKVGDYMTHPAFLAFNSTGFWVGKFETGYAGATTTNEAEVNSADTSKVIIKPNVISWRGINVGNAFQTSYEYRRNLESHMMKNTEWGAVAYLSHSEYGINKKVTRNGNSSYITGYASDKYNTENGYLASTTGNITGIYDMSGGAIEYTASYTTGSSIGVGGTSEITKLYTDFFTDNRWKNYYDLYSSTTNTDYYNRILGDATGEMGPFYKASSTNVSSWYGEGVLIMQGNGPWAYRGGFYNEGDLCGLFNTSRNNGGTHERLSFRIILIP